MTSDREELTKLQSDKAKLEKRIKELTMHKCGKTYGQMISKLLYEYVDNRINNMSKYTRYKYYSTIHYQVSSRLGVKTKVFTKEEYIQALSFIQNEYHYNIKDEYRV